MTEDHSDSSARAARLEARCNLGIASADVKPDEDLVVSELMGSDALEPKSLSINQKHRLRLDNVVNHHKIMNSLMYRRFEHSAIVMEAAQTPTKLGGHAGYNVRNAKLSEEKKLGREIVDLYELRKRDIIPAVQFLLPFLSTSESLTFGDPCCGLNKSIGKCLTELGFQVIESDKFFGDSRIDMLTDPIPLADAYVVNPPFSGKTLFVKVLLALNKPLAVLLPCESDTLEGMRKLFMANEVNFKMIMPCKTKFMHNGVLVNPLQVAWYFFNLGLKSPDGAFTTGYFTVGDEVDYLYDVIA